MLDGVLEVDRGGLLDRLVYKDASTHDQHWDGMLVVNVVACGIVFLLCSQRHLRQQNLTFLVYQNICSSKCKFISFMITESVKYLGTISS